jgi:hypothetical protein
VVLSYDLFMCYTGVNPYRNKSFFIAEKVVLSWCNPKDGRQGKKQKCECGMNRKNVRVFPFSKMVHQRCNTMTAAWKNMTVALDLQPGRNRRFPNPKKTLVM